MSLWRGVADTIEPRPALKSWKPEPKQAAGREKEYLEEYAEIAAAIGISPPDLVIEQFKAFLLANGITVFSLAEVISYMNDKAAKESKEKAGWEWRPLREKDNRDDMAFGTRAERADTRERQVTKPASDFYAGSHMERSWSGFGGTSEWKAAPSSAPYNRTVPLHALRKVALIEREFPGSVAFFVCDYAPRPEIRYPDPFLLAVIPNANVGIGEGRFVIDFWDEPGFGIEKQLK